MNLYHQQQQQQICFTVNMMFIIFILTVVSYNNVYNNIHMVESFTVTVSIVPKYVEYMRRRHARSFTTTRNNDIFIQQQQQQQQRMMLIDHVSFYKSSSLVLLSSSLSMKDDNNDDNDSTTTTTTTTTTSFSAQQQQQQSRKRMGELTTSEQIVYDIISELVQSNYTYRIIVMGGKSSDSSSSSSSSTGSSNGVILECTVPSFGPLIKVLQSPSTGANMVTIANHDQTFEYHIQLDTISKIKFVEKNTTNHKALRIIRLFSQNNNATISSIILMDTSDHAQNFFQSLMERYGNEIQL